ncbi:MAG: dephospho-CoA kinase [Acidimicrobiales bacterium]
MTGGIGSGKSTVAAMLESKGAALVDADVVARRVMAPGGAAHREVARRFPAVVSADEIVDRAALAAVVFADPAARADLEALTHPAIREQMTTEIAALLATSEVVVAVVPLLVEAPAPRPVLQAVVVVDCPPEVALARAVARGMTVGDATARMVVQASRAQRLALADFVVDNGGDRDRLSTEVDRCWEWARRRAGAAPS